MIRTVLGIIAGKRGGIAGIRLYAETDHPEMPYWCQPMPTLKGEVDLARIMRVYSFAKYLPNGAREDVLLAMQKVWRSSHGALVTRARYSYDAGIMEGIALTMNIKVIEVSYEAWVDYYPGMAQVKKRTNRNEKKWVAVNEANRLFPALDIGMDCNNSMAEALLLANFAAKELT